MYIDTHAHLSFPEYKDDLADVIQQAKAANIDAIINIALDTATIEFSHNLAKDYSDYIFNAAGLHPHDAKEWTQTFEDKIAQLAMAKEIIAIGEIGLDYHYKLSPLEQQQNVFRKFLRLAQTLEIPVIIHTRAAVEDTLRILRAENQGKLKGVFHCFAGDEKIIALGLEMGFFFSFTGNITFPKAEKVRNAAKLIPLDKIMLETDCPFLAPQNLRGQRNAPANVPFIAEKIAQIKGVSVEEVGRLTTRNARKLFNL